jgi:hypothetical protein
MLSSVLNCSDARPGLALFCRWVGCMGQTQANWRSFSNLSGKLQELEDAAWDRGYRQRFVLSIVPSPPVFNRDGSKRALVPREAPTKAPAAAAPADPPVVIRAKRPITMEGDPATPVASPVAKPASTEQYTPEGRKGPQSAPAAPLRRSHHKKLITTVAEPAPAGRSAQSSAA